METLGTYFLVGIFVLFCFVAAEIGVIYEMVLHMAHDIRAIRMRGEDGLDEFEPVERTKKRIRSVTVIFVIIALVLGIVLFAVLK